MKLQEYGKQFGGTAACTFRMADAAGHGGAIHPSRAQAVTEEKPEHIYGDSWFTSFIVCENLADKGRGYMGALKTNHRFFPKDDLEEKMKSWPSGSYLVMECTTPRKGHKLIAIGYRYNAKKTLCFLANKCVGSTKPGNPYIASFPDSVGNVCHRSVPRPSIISDYFEISNCIDSHNQARQFELGLERLWVTQDPWFRLDTAIIGVTVTDAWCNTPFSVTN